MILAATDFGPAGDEAIRQADRRARDRHARLAVCHVVPGATRSAPLFPQRNVAADLAMPDLRERVLAALASRAAALTGRSGQELDLHVRDGTPYVEIVELAETLAAELVVVGSHGPDGLAHAFLGSVAERVVRHAHCPVLVARPHASTGRVLLATDFSDPTLPAVAAAAEEARRRPVQVTILHDIEANPLLVYGDSAVFGEAPMAPASLDVLEETEASARERLGDALARHGLDGERVVTHGPVVPAIVDVARQIDADLVIVGTIGRSGWARVLLGSVAEAVVRRAPCSVLVVRLNRE
jgi:nucleotide-binding universal stress UspA family protein